MLYKMLKNIAVQMKGYTLSEKDQLSLIAYVHEFKSACDAYGILGSTVMWLLNQFLTDVVDVAVTSRVTLMSSAIMISQERIEVLFRR